MTYMITLVTIMSVIARRLFIVMSRLILTIKRVTCLFPQQRIS